MKFGRKDNSLPQNHRAMILLQTFELPLNIKHPKLSQIQEITLDVLSHNSKVDVIHYTLD